MEDIKVLLIHMLASIGISEDTALSIWSTLDEKQADEMMELLVEKHERGVEATEQEVIKAELILRGIIEVEDDDE